MKLAIYKDHKLSYMTEGKLYRVKKEFNNFTCEDDDGNLIRLPEKYFKVIESTVIDAIYGEEE